jgi:hypothetical protein
MQTVDAIGVSHKVSCLTLKENDSPFDNIVDPKFALFWGCHAPAEDPYAKTQDYDIASDPDRGTLSIDSSGDFRKETGVALLRKLVRRRLFTSVGGFVHMPQYGVGLRVKELLVNSDLLSLQSEIERQVMQEPELTSVRVRLQLAAGNILTIIVSAIMSSGQPLSIEEPVKQVTI